MESVAGRRREARRARRPQRGQRERGTEFMANAGYQVSVATIDVSSRETVQALVGKATGNGDIVGLIQAAGVSPSQASPETILHVDLYGDAWLGETPAAWISPTMSPIPVALPTRA